MILKDPVNKIWKIINAKCSTITCENIHPSVFFGDGNLNNTYVPRDSRTSCQLVSPFIINKHNHPFGICNPKYQCYLNCVIQALLPILRTIRHNFQFNSSTDFFLSKCLFETAHSASNSTDVDGLKFRIVQYDNSTMAKMLIEVINKDSVPYCFSNGNILGRYLYSKFKVLWWH